MRSPFFFDFFIDPVLRAPTVGAILMCFVTSLIGVLLGEALSHASFPGAILGALLSALFFNKVNESAVFVMLVGATFFSLLGFFTLEKMEKKLSIHPDAALCFVLSTFLGLGILLASRMQLIYPVWYQSVQILFYGQVVTLLDRHLWVYLIISLLLLTFLIFRFRQLELLHFDSTFSKSIGVDSKWVSSLITMLLILAIVISIRSVGVILMSGMLIAPAVAARQFTHRLSILFLLAGFIGACSGYGGSVLSVYIPLWMNKCHPISLPTGPMIVLFAAFLTILSFLFAPKQGIVSRFVRIFRFRFQCHVENLLKTFWKSGKELSHNSKEITQWNHLSKWHIWLLLKYIKKKGWIQEMSSTSYSLTDEGRKKGARLVRLHRLWEVYLVSCLNAGEERVHRSAEEMEHIITPELEVCLTELLLDPKTDPHAQSIPRGEEGV
jgi:manganese/zinc/iron transport system permease protein